MKFLIEKFLPGSKINIYSIRYVNGQNELDQFNETQKFFKSIRNDYPNDFILFKTLLRKIIDKSGAKKKFFRDETNSSCDYLYALINNDDVGRHYTGELRLFCLRFDEDKIIFGNGGIKTTQTYNEDPHLNTIARILQKLCYILLEKISEGDMWWDNKELKTKTNLEIEFEL